MKTKYIRANNSPFMTIELSKVIMVRSRLKNKLLKLKTIKPEMLVKSKEIIVNHSLGK